MKRGETQPGLEAEERTKAGKGGKTRAVFDSNIADSLDLLVEYLVENGIRGIHPLIMGEVEKRLIIKVLERSRGNKLQAAKLLGMSRNTFHRKIQKLVDSHLIMDGKPDA
jgi:DNA-binding protein Fis